MIDDIVKIIGPETRPIVKKVISLSREKDSMFHGVKNPAYLSEIFNKGVLPLTPEGNASYWSTVESLFGSYSGGVWSTQDSSFFRHAHSSGTHIPSQAHLLISSKNDIQLFEEKSGGTILVNEPVLPRQFSYVSIFLSTPDAIQQNSINTYNPAVDRALLYALYLSLSNNFKRVFVDLTSDRDFFNEDF